MTTTIGLTDGIIKRDSRGRLRTTPERREALLAEFDRSGMSGQKFAKWAGIKYTTFANWLQLRRKQGVKVVATAKSSGKNPVRWLEAVVGPSTEKAATRSKTVGLIVHGPGGIRIEITDPKQVSLAVQLLRELDGKNRC